MESLTRYLAFDIGPWDAWQLGSAFLVLLLSLAIRRIVRIWLGDKLTQLASRTETDADDQASRAVIGPLGLLVLAFGCYAALRILGADNLEFLATSSKVFQVLATVIVAWAAFQLVDAIALWMTDLAKHSRSRVDDQIAPLLRKTAKVFIAIIAFLLTIQNLGYSVSGLLAGLGIGGLAFALAAKDTIANLFGGVTILIDRPFRIGDWISTNEAEGVVEEIGLRSTRIRTFAKTLVTIPNQVLANVTVEDHSMMNKRRIKATIGLTYETTPDQMRRALAAIQHYLDNHAGIDQEFKLIKFTNFNTSSLDILLYCFTITTDWDEFLSLRQEVNLAVMDILADLGLEIAFPTETIHMAKTTRPEVES